LATVKYIHVRNDVLDERGNVDPAKFKPIARLGGTLYAKVSEGYHIHRYAWRDAALEVKNVL
jgi:flavin reductase (DIM6/NTAB) family NADH-FMN oxidoreductase RutF